MRARQARSRRFWLRAVALVFLSSTFVVIEPAPFDVLVVFLGFLFVARFGWPSVVINQWLAALLIIFTLAQLPGIAFSFDMVRAVTYGGITLYLLLSALFVAVLVQRYGVGAIFAILVSYSLSLLVTFLFIGVDKLHILNLEQILYFDPLRIKGFFKDPNVLGPASVVGLMVALPLAKHMKSLPIKPFLRRLFLVSSLLASAAMVYLSYSRGAWIAALIAIGVGIVATSTARLTFTRLAAAVIMTAAACVIVLSPATVGSVLGAIGSRDTFFAERFAGGQLQAYDRDRFRYQSVLINEAASNPLGFGPGQSEVLHSQFYNAISGAGAAHSSYVRVFFEAGWAGIVSYMGILAMTILIGWKLRDRPGIHGDYARALLSCAVALVVSGLTVDTIHWRHFWMVFGLLWGIYALVHSHEKRLRPKTRTNPVAPHRALQDSFLQLVVREK